MLFKSIFKIQDKITILYLQDKDTIFKIVILRNTALNVPHESSMAPILNSVVLTLHRRSAAAADILNQRSNRRWGEICRRVAEPRLLVLNSA